jgi:hypothetical protein
MHIYYPAWLDSFTAHDSDFHFVSYEINDLKPFLNWQPKGWAMNKQQPTGKIISFKYTSTVKQVKDVVIKVHYELYDGIPLIVNGCLLKIKQRIL